MSDEIKTDEIKQDPDSFPKAAEDKPGNSRRRFAKTGLGGGAVLMALLSRPALGTGYNDPRCTGSIMASVEAGSSLHNFDPDACRFGCTPGFWCGGASGMAWQKIEQLTGITLWSKFSDIFWIGPGPLGDGINSDSELKAILCMPNDGAGYLKQSARHSIAAWLNAHIMSSYFGITPQQIVDGYCQAFAAWESNNQNTGPLHNWKAEMRQLNQRGCPLDNDPKNMFYD